MRILTSLFTATLLAAATLGPAHALTSKEEAKLQALSPELRAEVKDRLGPEQTVDGILETMLLNRLSDMYANARYFKIDQENATIMVIGGPSDQETVQYNPRTLVLIQ